MNLKELRQLHYGSACQKGIKEGNKEIWGVVVAGQDPTQLSLLFVLTKTGRFLSSRPAWPTSRLGPGVVRILISKLDSSCC